MTQLEYFYDESEPNIPYNNNCLNIIISLCSYLVMTFMS